MGMLKQAKYYLPEAYLKTLYSSIAEPNFRYCCSVFRTCGVTEKIAFKNFKTERLELSPTANLIFSADHTERLGWRAIEELIAEKSKTIVDKSLHGLAPQYLCHLFVRNSAGEACPLRNTLTDLKIPTKSSVKGQKCFFVLWGKTMEQPTNRS